MARIISREALRQAGRLLRLLRLENRWTQAQVASRIGVDPVTVRRWELGLREPSEKFLNALAAIYELGVNDLLKSLDAPTQQTNRQLGLWLNDCRIQEDLSLEQAASRIGITPEILLSYENGQVDQDPQVLTRIAAQYGVSFSRALLNSMGMALRGHQTKLERPGPWPPRVIPIKGVVMAGIPRKEYDVDYGDITWPDFSVINFYPNAFAMVVSGDECGPDGIHDLDLIFIMPRTNLIFGKLYVVRINEVPYIRRLIAECDSISLRSSEGASQGFEPSTMEIVGEVVMHLRKIELGG